MVDPASGEQSLRGLLYRVPRLVPAHEVAVADALLVRALAEGGVGHVARVQERQLAHLARVQRAAFALLLRRLAGIPHVVVGDALTAALEGLEQRDRPPRADQRDRRVDLD